LGNSVVRGGTHTNTNTSAYTEKLIGYRRREGALLRVKTPVQALRLCTGRAAHRGSRGVALPFLDHATRRG